jgi:hypothetical protein
MRLKLRSLRRTGYLVAAVALVAGLGLPLLQGGKAAAAQLSTRSITLSDSGPSGNATITSGVGSGTSVSYKVSFTTFNAASSLVIDFCSNDPIISDTCNAPTGMSAASATLTGVTGNITSPGWSVTAAASQVKLAKGSGSAASVGSQVFVLGGITNPSTLGSFYARIYTYTNTTWGTYVGPAFTGAGTGPGNYLDYGGVALSTVQIITITARVQETLTFCVSGSNTSGWTTSHDCTDPNAATAPALTLGHGSPTAILDSSAVDTGTVYSQISTNATHGAVINMRNSNTTCGGLSADGGTTCAIPPVGSTASAITAGTADFGLFAAAPANDGSTGATGAGSFTVNTNYNDGTHTTPPYFYGMNATNVESTYGDTVVSTTAPCYRVDGAYTFGATAALTTPAGIYTANIAMIATGTF